jgi:hypothetical protein
MLESITSRMPELRELEDQIAKLTADQQQSQAKVEALQRRVLETREDDISRAAAALNRGKAAPPPKEAEVRAQLENAAYELEIVSRRLQLAQSDLSRFVSEHREEIAHHLRAVHAEETRRVSEGAERVLSEVLAMYQTEDEARQLARIYPEPQPEPEQFPEAQSLTTIWPLQSTQNFGGGPMRGDVQGVLEYLRSLGEASVAEVGPTEAEDDALSEASAKLERGGGPR